MRLAALDYHAPDTLEDACRLLATFGGGARIVAGGTDLLADMKQGKLGAGHLVALDRVPDLRAIGFEGDALQIGALVTANRLADSPEVGSVLPALADAAAVMGGNQIRNLATLGGNLVSAVPSADLPPALLVGGATALLVKSGGERRVPLDGFFTGPRKTLRAPDEVLAAVFVPRPPPASGSAYLKFQLRDASALAVVGVAARVVLSGGEIAEVRVAVGAAAPTPVLVPEVTGILVGDYPLENLFREAGEVVAEAISPIDDLRGSADYRRRLAAALTARALALATKRATGKEVE